MGQPYLSARVITSRVKTTPSTTNNMRCFILLALIAAASASCVNRVRTTYQQPAVQRSSSSSCFHSPQIYRPQPAPVYAPCYAPCYGCTGTFVSASDSSSKTYSAEPAVYEETIVPCDEPVEADPVQITKSVSSNETKSSSTKSTSNATKEDTRTSTHC